MTDSAAPRPNPAASASASAASAEREGDAVLAIGRYLRAASIAAAAGDTLEAVRIYTKALPLVTEPELRREVMERRARCATATEPAMALSLLDELARAAAADGDHEQQARARYLQYWPRLDPAHRVFLEEAMALADRAPGWSAKAQALAKMIDGEYEAALALDATALAHAEAMGDDALEVLALRGMANARGYVGDLEGAVLDARSAVHVAVAGQHADWAVQARLTLLDLLAELLKTQEALDEARRAFDFANDHSLTSWLPLCATYHALSLWRCGDLDAAAEMCETACAYARSGEDTIALMISTVLHAHVLADAYAPLHDVDAALEAAEAAGTRTGPASMLFNLVFAHAKRAALAGDLATATQLIAAHDIDEPASRAEAALWLARHGAQDGDRSVVEQALAVAADTSGNPLADLCVRELRAIGEATASGRGDGRQITECGREWERHGRMLDVRLARLTAAAIDERSPAAAARSRRVMSVESALFDGTTPEQRDLLEQAFSVAATRRGRVLFEDGDHLSGVRVVIDGCVHLRRVSASGKQLTVAVAGRGEVFGEGAVRRDGIADHAAVAAEDSLIAYLDHGQLERLAVHVPALVPNLMGILVDRAESSQRLAEGLAYWTVEQRMAQLLLDLDARFGHPTLAGHRVINQQLTQSDIAEMIGATRTAVTLQLSELRRRQVLTVERRRIVIQDPDALRGLAVAASA
jgi:CRP-like cAMP-binding protein